MPATRRSTRSATSGRSIPCRATAASPNRYSLALDGTATGPLFALPGRRCHRHLPPRRRATGIDSEATRRDGDIFRIRPQPRYARRLGQLRSADHQAQRVDRPADRQRQCRCHASERFRHADRRSARASAGRRRHGSISPPAGLARKGAPSLQQLGRSADPGNAQRQLLRLHHRRDGAGDDGHRRQSRPSLRHAQRVQDRRQLAAVRARPIFACAPNMSARRSTIPRPASRRPARRLEAAFPERFERDEDGNLVRGRPTAGQFRAVAPRHVPLGLRFHQAAGVEAAVAGGDRFLPPALRRPAWRNRAKALPPPPPEGAGQGAGPGGGGGSAASAAAAGVSAAAGARAAG